jgi:hypothetical protein
MKHKQAGIIFGSAISAAAIAVAIDHTRQRLPEPEQQLASQQAVIIIDEGEEIPVENNTNCDKPASTARPVSPCSL